ARRSDVREKGGEALGAAPRRRALLWGALCAFSASPAAPDKDRGAARRELLSRLAKVIRRLALTPEEIRKLPDNYAATVKAGTYPAAIDTAHRNAPFLPPDPFEENRSWVPLPNVPDEPLARAHARLLPV